MVEDTSIFEKASEDMHQRRHTKSVTVQRERGVDKCVKTNLCGKRRSRTIDVLVGENTGAAY